MMAATEQHKNKLIVFDFLERGKPSLLDGCIKLTLCVLIPELVLSLRPTHP